MRLLNLTIAWKRNKAPYYIQNHLRQYFSGGFYRRSLEKTWSILSDADRTYIDSRVSYYNRLTGGRTLGPEAVSLHALKSLKGPRAYFFDLFEFSRSFDQYLKVNALFRDVIHTPDFPTIQKSRPIAGDNRNAVLMKLDKMRHFLFIKDPVPFEKKKDMLIGRGTVSQPHRVAFMEKYFGHPLCDLGQVNKIGGGNMKWLKPKLSLAAHLDYKFILSLECNDVATNLKWIMSSGSVAVMPVPRYETWFMEGTLIPNVHYICIADDFSDLEEKLRYYTGHPEETKAIIRQANLYTRQFRNKATEDIISLRVLQKYFERTGQLD